MALMYEVLGQDSCDPLKNVTIERQVVTLKAILAGCKSHGKYSDIIEPKVMNNEGK